ncbi:MAG: family peptidase [Labilithrix sp.]|nr:family peptidase [Labilithrix sp.]
MMKKLRSSVILPLLAAACASVAACSTGDPSPPELADRLQSDTGAKWAVWVDPASHEVRFLSPVVPADIQGTSLEDKARTFFDCYRDQLHGTGRPDELRLVDTTVDDDGSAHLRFAHYLPGTTSEVFEVASTVHFTATGLLAWAQPGFRADLAALPTVARILPDAATKAANDHLAATCGPLDAAMLVLGTDLGVHAHEDRPVALAYRVRTFGASPSCVASDVLVDATTGDVLAVSSRASSFWDTATGARFALLGDKSDRKTIDVDPHFHFSGPTSYTLESEASPKVKTRRFETAFATKDYETTTLGSWEDPAPYKGVAISAHFHGFHALRFFKEVKLRSGGDDIPVIIHDDTSHTDFGVNAKCIDGVVYLGDGDVLSGGNTMPAAAAFDIVTHEITHSITNKTSKLAYRDESGALNESFSDVMGASAEEWFNETHDPKNNVVMGEGWTKDGTGERDMVDPRSHHDPDHKKDRRYCKDGEAPNDKKNDDCHVHSNSGIANRAFTLMTLGGTNRTSKITVANGIGWKAARELWYTTLTNLRPQATFWDAALAQIAVASTKGPETFTAVACAWYAVGAIELGTGFTIDPRLVGLTCPVATDPPKPADPPRSAPSQSSVTGDGGCIGRGNVIVCNDTAPSSAIVCKNGGIVGTSFCADLAQQCKRASAMDPTASLDADGALVCE